MIIECDYWIPERRKSLTTEKHHHDPLSKFMLPLL
jgi:hypothetical protein